jgi:hypothetical protein
VMRQSWRTASTTATAHPCAFPAVSNGPTTTSAAQCWHLGVRKRRTGELARADYERPACAARRRSSLRVTTPPLTWSTACQKLHPSVDFTDSERSSPRRATFTACPAPDNDP